MLKRDDAITTVVKFSTSVLVEVEKDGEKIKVPAVNTGTGFFMRRDEQNRLFLITAKHVVNGFNSHTIAEFIGKDSAVVTMPLDVLRQDLPIINHDHVDLSAIEISIPFFNALCPNVHIFATSLINMDKIKKLSRDVELTCIGFPNGLGTSDLFEPLSFRSFPSSNIIKNFEMKEIKCISDVFILENPACGGYSGCPVIDLGYIVSANFAQTYETTIYGVMSGTISDQTGGKMAVVIPAFYILELI